MRRSTGLSEREAPDLEITRMRRRHIRGVMAIERQVYPRPWSPSLFLSEIHAGRTRTYLVAVQGAAVKDRDSCPVRADQRSPGDGRRVHLTGSPDVELGSPADVREVRVPPRG